MNGPLTSSSRAGVVALSASLVLLTIGCGGGDASVDRRSAGSALWLPGEPSPEATPAVLATLRDAGIEELWFEGARLAPSGTTVELERLPAAALPARSEVAVVVGGSWPAGEIAVGEAVDNAAGFLRQLALDAETRGLEVRGFHLDLALDRPQGLESYGHFVDRLRKRLRRQGRLTARVEPGWLEQTKSVRLLLNGIDVAVVPLYGNGLGEADRPELWSLDGVAEGASRFDELRVPFLIEASLQGRAQRLGPSGAVITELAGLPIEELLASDLSVEPLFDFKGGLRQEFEALATSRPQIGTLTLGPRERLRVLRPTAYDIAMLNDKLDGLGLERYRGLVLRRWPRAGESLTLAPELLALALGDEPLTPELVLTVERSAADRISISIENRGKVPTALALVNHNYVELRLERARLGRVDVGEFKRVELENSKRAGNDMRALRRADVARLFYPALEPGARVSSGTIRIHATSGTPVVKAGARFFLPGGRTLELPLRDSSELAPGHDSDSGEGDGEVAQDAESSG